VLKRGGERTCLGIQIEERGDMIPLHFPRKGATHLAHLEGRGRQKDLRDHFASQDKNTDSCTLTPNPKGKGREGERKYRSIQVQRRLPKAGRRGKGKKTIAKPVALRGKIVRS